MVRWREYVGMARAAEEVGFDSLWVGDHLLYRDDGRLERGPWDAWTLLAGLAGVTQRVRIGPLVACTALRPPGVLARTAAAVNELSNGRLVLALGAGWNEAEFRAFGLPFDNRFARFREAFEMMIGAVGQSMLAATLPYVDAWNTWYDWYGNTPAGFAEANQRIDEAAVRVARDPATISRSACVLVVLDRAAGERPLDEGIPPVEGSADRIAAGLEEFAEAGADEVILVLDPITERSTRVLGESLAILDESSFTRR